MSVFEEHSEERGTDVTSLWYGDVGLACAFEIDERLKDLFGESIDDEDSEEKEIG